VIRLLKNFYHWIKFQLSVNWIKTLYFNFKMFPLKEAIKLPIYFYGKVKFTSLKGSVKIEATLKRSMIGFGQIYEMNKSSKGISELYLNGIMVFKGYVQFGKDYFIYIGENAYSEFGSMSSIGSDGKLICMDRIILGNFARIGYESQLLDTNFHQMIDTLNGKKYPITNPILIGNFNYIGSRVSIMSKTITPDFCTIASNSVCNKDYTFLGENILIGGVPSKLLKENISRDWEGERNVLEELLKLNS
jgi:acetyltransferase-like isoleucine patch superfamily enzyme